MILDYLIYAVIVWMIASLLNLVKFNAKPASKIITWILTVTMFFVGIIALSAAKLIRYQVMPSSIGVHVALTNPLDIMGAVMFSWLFYSLIKKRSRVQSLPSESYNESLTIDSKTSRDRETVRDPKLASSVTDHLYEVAWSELEDGAMKKSLWSKLFVEFNGDINKIKARYIELRVAELEDQEEEQLKQAESEKRRALANRTDEDLMRDHGINFDGTHYNFGPYRYTSLRDAVNYAKLQQGNK